MKELAFLGIDTFAISDNVPAKDLLFDNSSIFTEIIHLEIILQ